MDFLGYWPLQRDPVTGNEINICAYFQGDDSSMTATVCGDNGMINTEGIILDVPNPKFEDEIGAATTFGDFQTCPTPDVLEQTPTPALEEGTGNPTTQATPIATTEQNEVDDGSTLPATDDETPPPATSSSPEATAPPSINESLNPSPTNANDDDDDDVCFPGSATVELRNGHVKPMRDLSVGDEVLVGAGGQYSAVMMFTHKDAQRIYRFVALETSCGQTLHATSSHYIYANDVLTEAGDVRAGDLLEGADGRKCEVRKVGVKQMQGLYNPQTVHGDVVVDGVRASTYTRAVSVETAHALLAPVRWMFAAVGLDASAVVIGL